MKKLLVLFSLIISAAGVKAFFMESEISTTENITTAPPRFHDLKIKSLDEKKNIKFSDFKGKKVLVVNVASECGYTPQYEGLEELSKKYKKDLVVIGIPCNQFGGQEPGNNEEIESFCKKNYGVTFLLTEKVEVKGPNQHPVYQWLTQKEKNGAGDFEVKWNFNKFLINEKGELMKYFPSKTAPLSEELTKAIEVR